jgi:hypothetical protein
MSAARSRRSSIAAAMSPVPVASALATNSHASSDAKPPAMASDDDDGTYARSAVSTPVVRTLTVFSRVRRPSRQPQIVPGWERSQVGCYLAAWAGQWLRRVDVQRRQQWRS